MGQKHTSGRAPRRTPDDTLTLAGLFIEIDRGLRREMAAIHQRHGLRGVEFDVLLRVSRSPDESLRMTDLSVQTGMSTSGITTVVERLLADELITRQPSAADRRSSIVRITARGSSVLRDTVRDLVPLIRDTLEGPAGSDLAVLQPILARIRDRVEPGATGRG